MTLLPVAVALLVSAQIPLSTQVQLPTGETAELAADLVVYESDQQLLTATGHAELRSGGVLLRADELTYDQDGQKASARGNVMFVSGLMSAVADEVHVDLATNEATVKGGLFMQKRGVTAEALLQAKTPQELRELGETPLLISGTRIKRRGPNAFTVDDMAFTPCECGPGEPSWRVEASAADVVMGERATLTWPVVYVHSVPVFALPWLYLPLAERRTGILVPRPTISGLSGFGFEQPVFVTLGRSYDMTFTPGWFTGATVENTFNAGTPEQFTRKEPSPNGIRGPRLLNEFRYVPSVSTTGRATLGFTYDLQPERDPRNGAYYRVDNLPTTPIVDVRRGLRGEASWQHRQELGNGFHDRVDASVVSDGFYVRDITADILARENQYLRSTGTVFHRADDSYAGLDVTLRQDVRWGYKLLGEDRVPAATDPAQPVLAGPITIQRLPTLTFFLPERPLGRGPLVGGFQAQFTRLSPLFARSGDEGEDGLFNPYVVFYVQQPNSGVIQTLPDLAQGNGIFDASDREARNRLDLMPRLSASFALGRFARLSPYAALRHDIYMGELSGRVSQRGYPILGLTLDSEVARGYARKKDALFHSIKPSVEVRWVPMVWGGVPSPGASPDRPPQPYDEIDTSLPVNAEGEAERFLQAVARVTQVLYIDQAQQRREVLRLTLGQGMELSASDGQPVLRDSFARVGAAWGVLSAGAQIRLDPNSWQITQLSADATIDNGRGAALYMRYDDLLLVGSDQLRRGIDALVGPPADESQRAQQLVAGMRFTLGIGLGLRYEALVQPLARDDQSPLAQQVLGVSYGPACDCWRVEGVATLRRGQPRPDFGLNLTVAGFGSFGSGG
ncbi:LPS assembly protein LptD [Myxococcaceae bacterium GXIMD 01537]